MSYLLFFFVMLLLVFVGILLHCSAVWQGMCKFRAGSGNVLRFTSERQGRATKTHLKTQKSKVWIAYKVFLRIFRPGSGHFLDSPGKASKDSQEYRVQVSYIVISMLFHHTTPTYEEINFSAWVLLKSEHVKVEKMKTNIHRKEQAHILGVPE